MDFLKNFNWQDLKHFILNIEHLQIIALSFFSIIVIFILTKLMGYKQMSQLSMFDYVNGITIGSIAAEMATSLEEDFTQPLIAMCIYAITSIVLSLLASKSIKLQRLIVGKSLILYNNGDLYRHNLKKAKLDLGEFLTQCRVNGYFDLSTLQSAILEPNGKISFLPLAEERPLTPKDLELKPPAETLHANVIVDGHIMKKNLKHTGNNEKWLRKQLGAYPVKDISEVFLATCDQSNHLNVYIKLDQKMNIDYFN